MQKIDKSLFGGVETLGVESASIKCIVFLKNGFPKVIFKNLVGEQNICEYFPFLNAYVIKIKKSELKKLASFEIVEYVSSIQKASILLFNARKYLRIDEIHKLGYNGLGVTVAVIDTGCYPHLDFCLGHNRIVEFVDLVNNQSYPYDDNGHGTFVCGVLGGSGLVFNKKYKGIAPNSNLVVIKALDKNGETTASTILSAMQWVLDNKERLNIKVVCMSFGSNPLDGYDPLMEGAKVLWENGICVVCAGGNDGPNEQTIKSPGACPNVITVGSSAKLDEEKEIDVAPFSSRGPAFDYVKPDIIAPGVEIVSTTNGTDFYSTMSGTSVSTPFVAGICALLLQKDKTLMPNEIKSILMSNAQKLSDGNNAAGSGFVCVDKIFFN